ncbi:transmembrane protein 135-like isoform X2 [Episyrphus balteatus]|uniref:transmembrane protein 135-like isoform X2 n=1 Tax=Episyrphus balteatus TaxID=286459 RepID=UPI0024867491|nr:transmembrane protein 135-like isoform X2 [Episyrphus balteatus]
MRKARKIMTNVQSKFSPIFCTCREFLHPWTDSCTVSTADILINSVPQSIRIYAIVYALSLVMRHRIPTQLDLKRTLLGIIQSTAFLSTNSFTFVLYVCLFRNVIGKFYFLSNTFLPAYLASLTAIYIERPVRRPLLALYVANVATETIWRMAESRGFVKSIPKGQAIIFGVSVSVLLYLYRLGLHNTEHCKDSIFDILRIFVGKDEECMTEKERPMVTPAAVGPESVNNTSISRAVRTYLMCLRWLKGKHDCCPHREGCLQYALMGGVKPFIGGVGLQVVLKIVLNARKILSGRMNLQKNIFDAKTLGLGIFLGSFSFLYKGVSCTLRNIMGKDDARYAIPAGLFGSIAFTQYPDITVALYVMWKSLQIVYNFGESKKKLPKVRGFLIFLYCFCTATLFHAAIIEPLNLRPSYYKFLHSLSGGRVGMFNRTFLDVWGLESSVALREVMKRTGTEKLPKKLLGA